MERLLLAVTTPLRAFTRTRIRKTVKNKGDNFVQYPGIKYYPRNLDEKDPEFEPSKLLMVKRIKPVKGRPHWERYILRSFKIEEETGPAIVKNIPNNNARLWRVKHLVRITPITFPYGEPTENDINYTILHENGQCVVKKELEVPEERIKLQNEILGDPKRITKATIEKDCRYRWLNPWNGGY